MSDDDVTGLKPTPTRVEQDSVVLPASVVRSTASMLRRLARARPALPAGTLLFASGLADGLDRVVDNQYPEPSPEATQMAKRGSKPANRGGA
jgi:hypothetical protein